MTTARIVVVDDDEFMREGLIETLAGSGHRVEGFPAAEDALDTVADGTASLLITDLRMPGMGGMGLLEQARRLVGYGAPAIHVYTLNRWPLPLALARLLGHDQGSGPEPFAAAGR